MDKVIAAFAVVLMGTLVAAADPPPEEFAGIKWGATMTEATKIMSQRPGTVIESSRGNTLRYKGGTFAGFIADGWELVFGAKGFEKAVVWALHPSDSDSFQKMKMAIVEKYGGGRTVAVGTRPPPSYNWIEQQWENRRASKPSPDATWSLRTSFSSHNVFIRCSPSGGNRVRVTYVNQSLEKAEPPATPRPLIPVKRDL